MKLFRRVAALFATIAILLQLVQYASTGLAWATSGPISALITAGLIVALMKMRRSRRRALRRAVMTGLRATR